MHLVVYKSRPDVLAICHAHPQKATAFAVARQVCEKIALPEVIFSIGYVALANYATPTTQEVPDSIMEIVKTSDAILLSNHGALTVGSDVYDAYYKMETLEHFAGITLYARLLGGEVGLEPAAGVRADPGSTEKYGKSDLGMLGDRFCGGKAIENDAGEKNIKDTIEQIVRETIAKLES